MYSKLDIILKDVNVLTSVMSSTGNDNLFDDFANVLSKFDNIILGRNANNLNEIVISSGLAKLLNFIFIVNFFQ